MTDWLRYDDENISDHEQAIEAGDEDCGDLPAIWEFWYDGERKESLCNADNLTSVVSEITDLVNYPGSDPNEIEGWRIKNLVSGEVITGTQLLGSYGHLYPA